MRFLIFSIALFFISGTGQGDECKVRRITVLNGTVTMDVPVEWVLSEERGHTLLKPSQQDVIELAFVALVEDDPNAAVDDSSLKAFLRNHAQAKTIERLEEGRFLGEAQHAQKSGAALHRWSLVKVTGKREISALFVSYQPSSVDPKVRKTVLRLIRTAEFVPKK